MKIFKYITIILGLVVLCAFFLVQEVGETLFDNPIFFILYCLILGLFLISSSVLIINSWKKDATKRKPIKKNKAITLDEISEIEELIE